MEMQERQMAMSEHAAGLIDSMTYYEMTGKENGTEIKKRIIEDNIRNLPSVQEKMNSTIGQQLGLIDEENAGQAAEEIQQLTQGGMTGQPPRQGAASPDMNRPLTPDTVQPTRIDLA